MERYKRKQEIITRTVHWFEKYITEGYSVRQIAEQRNILEYRVRRDIQYRLDASQINSIDEIFPNVHHIMIDGYWLPKMKNPDTGVYESKVLLLYYDYIHEKVIWFSIRDWEKKVYIVEDLKFLRDHMRYTDIHSCTSDGWVSILVALREIYPYCIIQRCLVHIQRQIRTYLTRNPKSQAGREFLKLSSYTVLSDPVLFPKQWEEWKQIHQDYINEKTIRPITGWWKYTHTNLRKAINLINNALPYMFQSHQHNNPDIKQSSNKIEWYFGVFAEEWIKEHKWLSPSRLYAFTSLWIYLRNQK